MNTEIIMFSVFSPLIGFLVNYFLGKQLGKKITGIIATMSIVIPFVVACMIFLDMQSAKEVVIKIDLFEWIRIGDFKVDFSFYFDQLSVLWLLFVTGIGSLIHLYSTAYMNHDENHHKFFAYLNLFVFFMMLLVLGSNLLIMFVGWEGVGLCSYLLIGFWHKNQSYNDAAKKAFIMNRVGDLGFLIGTFILIHLYGTIDFQELRHISEGTTASMIPLLSAATLSLFVATTGKSAQLPLYTWLPDAMAGPTPVSALIHAATMVTAGIFMITRLNFLFDMTTDVQTIIAVVGALTALIAASIGLVQNDIKKVLAYSTVSQLGLMFLALGLGAYEVAVFHTITHAFFKACLFLGSGSVIHAVHNEQDMRYFGGLKKYMTITHITFLISALAISGVPPFSGFFSKDEILMTAFHKSPALYIIGSLASIMTAFYMFRLVFLTFYNDFRGTKEQKEHLHESPIAMTLPLVILAGLAIVGGVINLPGSNWLNHYLEPVIVNSAAHHPHHLGTTEYILMGVAVVGALIGIFLAYNKYISKKEVPADDNKLTGFSKVLSNRLYLDEVYMTVIVLPLNMLGKLFKNIVETLISSVVLSFGVLTNGVSAQLKKAQTGNIGLYLFAFVFGVCAILYFIYF